MVTIGQHVAICKIKKFEKKKPKQNKNCKVHTQGVMTFFARSKMPKANVTKTETLQEKIKC